MAVIKKNLVKKAIELFGEIAENKEDFKKFYENFHRNIKLGIHEDSQNRAKLAELLRSYLLPTVVCSLSYFTVTLLLGSFVSHLGSIHRRAATNRLPCRSILITCRRTRRTSITLQEKARRLLRTHRLWKSSGSVALKCCTWLTQLMKYGFVDFPCCVFCLLFSCFGSKLAPLTLFLFYSHLFLVFSLRQYCAQQLKDFKDKKLVCVTKEGLELEDSDEEKKRKEEEKTQFEGLCKKLKEILGDQVEKVILGYRLVDSPCCLVTGEFGWSANMERIMKVRAWCSFSLLFRFPFLSFILLPLAFFASWGIWDWCFFVFLCRFGRLKLSAITRWVCTWAGSLNPLPLLLLPRCLLFLLFDCFVFLCCSKKTMEINPRNSIIKELNARFSKDANDRTVKDLSFLLFETALLTSGFTLAAPNVFANRIHKLIKLGLSIQEEESPSAGSASSASSESSAAAGSDDSKKEDDLPPLETPVGGEEEPWKRWVDDPFFWFVSFLPMINFVLLKFPLFSFFVQVD